MSSVEGWISSTLGDACEIEIGGTPSRSTPNYWDVGKSTSNLWVSIRDLNRPIIYETNEYISDDGVRHSNVKLQKQGTILLSFKLTIGKVAYAGSDLYTNEAIAGLQAHGIHPDFLYHGLQHWDLLQGVDQAIKGATLNKAKLRKIAFHYPASQQEQTQIATILSTIDKAIEQTEAIIAKQQRIKTGLMQDLLTCGIDDAGNIRSEATHEFKDSPLGRIPVEWEVDVIGKYGLRDRPYLRTGPFGSDLNTKHWVNEGIPVLTIGSLGEGVLLYDDLLYISESKAEQLNSFRVQEGDIVFSRVADIGRSLVIEYEQENWIISSNLMRISLDMRKTEAKYVYRNVAFSEAIKSQLRSLSNFGGRELVNGEILSNLVFPWPSIEEQRRINKHLDKFDDQRGAEINHLHKLRKQKSGLMQDLLTGKVRVTDLLNPSNN